MSGSSCCTLSLVDAILVSARGIGACGKVKGVSRVADVV